MCTCPESDSTREVLMQGPRYQACPAPPQRSTFSPRTCQHYVCCILA